MGYTINNLRCVINKPNWSIHGGVDDSKINLYGTVIDDFQADTGIVIVDVDGIEYCVNTLCLDITDENNNIIYNDYLELCKQNCRDEN